MEKDKKKSRKKRKKVLLGILISLALIVLAPFFCYGIVHLSQSDPVPIDKMKERQITIVCDKAMEYQFGLRLNPKNRTDRLLPEVLTTVVKQQGEMRFEVLISDVVDGEYRCLLVNESTFESLPMRASDAILFALISNTPIYIDYNLMMRQSVRYSANANGMAIPINALSDSMLKKSMENAIADENYELASYLRNEIWVICC